MSKRSKRTTRDMHESVRAFLQDALDEAYEKIDKLLAHCPDAECMECAKIICPVAEPLHFHHDGCPACQPPAVCSA